MGCICLLYFVVEWQGVVLECSNFGNGVVRNEQMIGVFDPIPSNLL